MSLKSWILAARPKTLSAAAAPVIAGAAAAAGDGSFLLWPAIFALLGAGAIQVATNFFNDALDYEKGADTGERLGPVRVTQSGLIPPGRVMRAGFLAMGIALLCGIPLVIRGGTPILVLGLVSLLLGYAYTGGPLPLAYKGLGEVFVFLFFGLAAVCGVYYLETMRLSPAAFLAGAQAGLLATALLAVNNLRDHEEDRRTGKLTLAARFGLTFGRFEISALTLAPYPLGLFWLLQGKNAAAFLPFFTLPLALHVTTAVFRTPPSRAYNQILARTAALQLTFTLLLSVGLLF